MPARLTPNARLFLAATLASSWLALLLTGHVLGGAVHLLLAGALVAYPWKLPPAG